MRNKNYEIEIDISMDRYRSSAHFANFQVRSLLNRSQKDQWFALIKER